MRKIKGAPVSRAVIVADFVALELVDVLVVVVVVAVAVDVAVAIVIAT